MGGPRRYRVVLVWTDDILGGSLLQIVRASALLHGQGRNGGGWPHEADNSVCQGRCREDRGRRVGDGRRYINQLRLRGSDSWPNFASVGVMDLVSIFVGDVDGARRHAVGAGLTPLGQLR
jgi:hypothetical protein